ncbi:MAG: dihydrofolate reductase [Micavibrio sp.]|nr:MAG: dihydrofolate reductase [Micavibrio sp.]
MYKGFKISLVAAMSDNRVIGRGSTIPWRAKGDLRFFKEQTENRPVIMGRKTFESLKNAGVQPLPGRPNLVVTTRADYCFDHPDVSIHHSMDDALHHAAKLAAELDTDTVCIGGGAEIYKLSLPVADIIHLTEIHCMIEDGDTFFPDFSRDEWQETRREYRKAENGDTADYSFVTWQRA